MAEPADFQQKQYAFAAHIRDPEHNPAPEEIEDRRMGVYRELFYNNLFSLLSSTFPVLKKIHSDDAWRKLIRQFMIHHKAETPYFLEVPQEFLKFLKNDSSESDERFSFLQELAHYEWIELELSVSTLENDWEHIEPEGDLLEGAPVKSRLAYLLTYQFPVHKIDAEFLPDTAGEQPTYLAIFRRANDELGFMELNPVTARLLQLIEENNEQKRGRDLLTVLATEMSYADPGSLIAHGHAAMLEMLESEILLGTYKQHRIIGDH